MISNLTKEFFFRTKFLVHDRAKNHIRLESSMHGTLDFVHADIKGEVCLWLSVNGMYHTSIQIYDLS